MLVKVFFSHSCYKTRFYWWSPVSKWTTESFHCYWNRAVIVCTTAACLVGKHGSFWSFEPSASAVIVPVQTVSSLEAALSVSQLPVQSVSCSDLWVNVTLGLLYFCAIWPHRRSHQSPTAAAGRRPPLRLHQRQLYWRECVHMHRRTQICSPNACVLLYPNSSPIPTLLKPNINVNQLHHMNAETVWSLQWFHTSSRWHKVLKTAWARNDVRQSLFE